MSQNAEYPSIGYSALFDLAAETTLVYQVMHG